MWKIRRAISVEGVELSLITSLSDEYTFVVNTVCLRLEMPSIDIANLDEHKAFTNKNCSAASDLNKENTNRKQHTLLQRLIHELKGGASSAWANRCIAWKGRSRINFNFPSYCFLASEMVLDPGAQDLAEPQKSKRAGPPKVLKKVAERKSGERNGIRSHSSLAPTQLEAPLRPVSQVPGPLTCSFKVSKMLGAGTSLVSNGHCSWMRRSESSYSVNSTGSDCSRARIRNATSLPHITKYNAREPPPVKSPCLLVALRPINVDKEKEIFFQSKYTYNPQFEYSEPLSSSIMSKYSIASDRFIEQ
ncbi:hypothetical protein scyTo_0015526, partial [Scyliorhinus torazame]|nr:hypothetical protein [Scyliorhinus torazame]